jgi:hypothetical protein
MNSAFPANVVNSTNGPIHSGGDSVFLIRQFDALRRRMGAEFERFTFVVHHWAFGQFAGTLIPLDPGGPNRVLVVVGDEKEVFPVEEFSSYRVIFRAYGNPAGGASRVHSFPAGYLDAAGEAEPVSFQERGNSVFFSGYLNRNRVDLYKQFRHVWWLPRRNLKTRHSRELARRIIEKFYPKRQFEGTLPGARIGFTKWFGKGLAPEEYARILASSKIALCPPGFVSHETIRHWEAMRLGCVVISAPLPPNRFYKDSPIIQLNDWSELRPLLDDLLRQPEKLMQLHEKTVDWWKHVCSEEAVADYMARVIMAG